MHVPERLAARKVCAKWSTSLKSLSKYHMPVSSSLTLHEARGNIIAVAKGHFRYRVAHVLEYVWCVASGDCLYDSNSGKYPKSCMH